jgi:YidC/Oxa1 family membrane protein insertase
MEPEIKLIKKNFPNKEEQAKKTFELYKKYGTNPFSGCIVILIQLPVIFALYFVIYKGLSLDTNLVYPFLSKPTLIHTNFLGLIEINSKNLFLAIVAGVTQFIQGYLASPITSKVEITKDTPNSKEAKSFQDELSGSMQTNVKYILPIFIVFIAWRISAAVALYFVISNIFTIVQEWYIRKTLDNK